MARYHRVRAQLSDEVSVSAQSFWEILLDWPAILDWMREEGRPVPLSRVTLKPGHVLGKLPCTRDCHFEVDKLPPGVPIPALVQETLLHADPEARFIYYNMEGEGPFGMRNYLATTEVDDLGAGRCRVTCSGRMDVPEGAPTEMIQGFIQSVYDSIIHDIPKLAAKRGMR